VVGLFPIVDEDEEFREEELLTPQEREEEFSTEFVDEGCVFLPSLYSVG
jgi:hypothetical protein